MIYVADLEKMADPGREGEGSGKRVRNMQAIAAKICKIA